MAKKSNNSAIVPGCYDDLEACLSAPFHCIPTVEFRLINFELPLSASDIGMLSDTPLEIFVADPANSTNNTRYSSTKSVSDNSLKILGDFLLFGVCVYCYGEPVGLSVEGNRLWPRENVATDPYPASPSVVRTDAPSIAQLGLGDDVNIEGAELHYGAPVWDAIADFMRAYRLTMYCPDNANAQLLDEHVSDIGNCCAIVDWDGFSRLERGIRHYERVVNDRLGEINQADNPIQGSPDLGYFLAINSDQSAPGGVGEQEVVPARYMPVPAAYGRPKGQPNLEYWYRLACPVPLMSETLIKIEFNSRAGDAGFLQRLIEDVSVRLGVEPFAGAGANHVCNENGQANEVVGRKAIIPGGAWRVGIGLKGFRVSGNVCRSLADTLAGQGAMTSQIMMSTCAGRSSCGG